ncbi:MAG: YihY/virulence factor BrkB family protein [Streptosporangiales bacterium]|nr:YihY/virulence factor BrkB family protein [Streptosporangiales bacterium]
MAKPVPAGRGSRVKVTVTAVKERGETLLRRARARSQPLDHLVRAYVRYDERRGDRLAAAVTFFGFLSFFPLLALGFAVAGYAVVVYPEARTQLLDAVRGLLPGITEQLDVGALASARAGAGLFALVGLLIAGIGWIDALRESLHEIWLKDPKADGNFVTKKLMAVAVLIVLGLCLIASVAVSSLATSATALALRLAGLAGSVAAAWVLKIFAVAVVLLFDVLIFLMLFCRLSGSRAPWRQVYRGAVLGAVGFEVLKLVGTYYVPLVAANPVYGAFGLTIGLLVWINLVTRFTVFAAAWTATAAATRR